MLILYKMDISDPRLMRAYRLQVKERLYRFNFVSSSLFLSYKCPDFGMPGNTRTNGEGGAT